MTDSDIKCREYFSEHRLNIEHTFLISIYPDEEGKIAFFSRLSIPEHLFVRMFSQDFFLRLACKKCVVANLGFIFGYSLTVQIQKLKTHNN